MRSVILSVAASVDNCIARPDGSVNWLSLDGDYGMTAFFKSIDTVLMGRATHDFAVEHGMPSYEGLKNYVFTSQRDRKAYKGVTYVHTDPAAFVKDLKQQPGKKIWLCGGAQLADSLWQVDLVDEISVAMHPRVLGDGIRLFDRALPERELKLTKNQAWPNGLVVLEYEVIR